jgi:hypothetical protein
MGLDNYPTTYPCQARGVAVYVTRTDKDGVVLKHEDGTDMRQFSCSATKYACACPWQNHPRRPAEGAVYGMLGTDCWYRGKYGVFLYEQLGLDGSWLYGDDHLKIAGDTLLEEAANLRTRLEEVSVHGKFFVDGGADLRPDVEYLIWWLEFVAIESDEVTAWY